MFHWDMYNILDRERRFVSCLVWCCGAKQSNVSPAGRLHVALESMLAWRVSQVFMVLEEYNAGPIRRAADLNVTRPRLRVCIPEGVCLGGVGIHQAYVALS